jgi:hypothetical protein
MESNHSITYFADVARRYCAWAEEPPAGPGDDMHSARRLLAELHLAVLDLPTEIADTETHTDSLTADDWTAIRGRFQHLPVNGYSDVFNPLVDEPPVFNTLFDDLSDIWRDLKEGLVLYDRGEIEAAVWEWQFNFEIHWGRHLTGAQRAIHAYFSEPRTRDS